jgi:hypothetical protein
MFVIRGERLTFERTPKGVRVYPEDRSWVGVYHVQGKALRLAHTTSSNSKPQGVILYRGPSLIDGTPIVCVATGLARKSKNPKTGKLIQTYILADDSQTPVEAWKSGGDKAICGQCPHRGTTCYVDVTKGPLSVYRAVQRGTYPQFDPKLHARLFRGRVVRLGSYGDPAAVPLEAGPGGVPARRLHRGASHQPAEEEVSGLPNGGTAKATAT